jgi:GNAT superfamily N-acetyltransferase
MTSRFSLRPSSSQLGQAVEHNLTALFRAMTASLEGDLLETESLSMHHAFPSNPMFHGVWGANLEGDAVDGAIDRAIAWFKEREAPFFFWWVGPSSRPAELGKRLQARGLLSVGEQAYAASPTDAAAAAPCMTMDLEYVDEGVLQQTPAEFSMREASREADLHAFQRVFTEAYGTPEWAAQAWVDATLHAGFELSPWRIYVGWLGEQPVATTILFIGGNVASVYSVATIPAARKRGIGAAITLRPLLQARDQGLRHAVLFSTDVGVRVYERIGFQRTASSISRYLWRAP